MVAPFDVLSNDRALRRARKQRASLNIENRSVRALALLLCAWVVDYRAQEGDAIAIVLQAGGLLATILIVTGYFTFGATARAGGATVRTASLIAIFVAYAAVVGLMRGQDAQLVIKTALPVCIAVVGIIMTRVAIASCHDVRRVRRTILSISVASTALKPLIVFALFRGVTLDIVRYEVISGSMLVVVAYCIVSLSVSFGWKQFLIAALAAAIIILSVTRTYLLVPVAMFLAHLVLSPRSIIRGRFLRTVAYISAALLCFSLVSDNAVVTPILGRWTQRLSSSQEVGVDLTALTRIAEAQYQLDSISNLSDGLVGRGIAARTEMTGEAAKMFRAILPNNQEVSSVGFGHTGQTSVLFVAGWLVGGGFLLLTLVWLWRSSLLLRRTLRFAKEPGWFIACWGATAVVGFWIYGLFGGWFGDRGASLYFGVAIGMMLSGWDALRWSASRKHEASLSASGHSTHTTSDDSAVTAFEMDLDTN